MDLKSLIAADIYQLTDVDVTLQSPYYKAKGTVTVSMKIVFVPRAPSIDYSRYQPMLKVKGHSKRKKEHTCGAQSLYWVMLDLD